MRSANGKPNVTETAMSGSNKDREDLHRPVTPDSGRFLIGRGPSRSVPTRPRERPAFAIAAPVTWKQLERGVGPDAFHMGA
jgi:hypothetical protein